MQEDRGSRYYKRHAERIKPIKNARIKVRMQQYRERIFDLLGNTCVHCGYSDKRALQIDHINGNGNFSRRNFASYTQFYKYVLAVGKTEFQTLCANCNFIKSLEEREAVNWHRNRDYPAKGLSRRIPGGIGKKYPYLVEEANA